MAKPQTYVYVDGFNLYYGSLKGTAHKWLDLQKLVRQLLPQHDVVQIRYFTARVSAMPPDSQQPRRQEAYLRALGTFPEISLHYGHFLVNPTFLPLEKPPAKGSRLVRVLKTEEKGSDVNLATELLVDAACSRFEEAVVVSNDSDLMAPIVAVSQHFKKPVGVLHPHRQASRELRRVATFCRSIPAGALRASQLPTHPGFVDQSGFRIKKPPDWK
ncbi:MAG TPA: NYN domain-containing protein [Candidatus Dormibacteraeota bacterium]|jgi:hypothetical protein|nr:NYN domain-containing protein [Candidatus Dormibacteraeota bacterium]